MLISDKHVQLCELCLLPRSREESNMASDREEERQSESESSVDIRELLPRDGLPYLWPDQELYIVYDLALLVAGFI